jgi:hypothetical protein
MTKINQVDNTLKRNGWVKKFDADEPRLSELVKLYESIGFEVKLEPLNTQTSKEQCNVCLTNTDKKIMTIYVKPKVDTSGSSEIY